MGTVWNHIYEWGPSYGSLASIQANGRINEVQEFRIR
jgi:hypothetical protein